MALTYVFRRAIQVDAWLLAVPKRSQRVLIACALAILACLWAPYVPQAFVDYSRIPLLNHVKQAETYGSDTISDMYESRVILNDPRDMYTKSQTAQTPLEAATWSKAASAPYPPVALLVDTGLYRIGGWIGVGFYGMILALACAFLGLSAWYFLQTRWYLFPAIYLSSLYFGYRFVYVQDDTYLVMLVVVMAALVAARRGSAATHVLMALATVIKLSPLYYMRHVAALKRSSALLFCGVIVAGLIAPYFVWSNYLYIFRFQNATKATGGFPETAGAILVGVLFTTLLWYVESRGDFDLEDKVGWALVPFSMFLAYQLNAERHLLIVLLVPDKRAVRNIAAAGGMLFYTLFPSAVHLTAVLSISTGLLVVGLVYHLERIGWELVRDDFRHPLRTARLLARVS